MDVSMLYKANIPITKEGLLLKLKAPEKSYIHLMPTYFCTFFGYKTYEDGTKGTAEFQQLIRGEHDWIVEVDGLSMNEKSYEEVIKIIKDAIKEKLNDGKEELQFTLLPFKELYIKYSSEKSHNICSLNVEQYSLHHILDSMMDHDLLKLKILANKELQDNHGRFHIQVVKDIGGDLNGKDFFFSLTMSVIEDRFHPNDHEKLKELVKKAKIYKDTYFMVSIYGEACNRWKKSYPDKNHFSGIGSLIAIHSNYGCFVTHIAVTNGNYNKGYYGDGADGRAFAKRGIGSLLISIAQYYQKLMHSGQMNMYAWSYNENYTCCWKNMGFKEAQIFSSKHWPIEISYQIEQFSLYSDKHYYTEKLVPKFINSNVKNTISKELLYDHAQISSAIRDSSKFILNRVDIQSSSSIFQDVISQRMKILSSSSEVKIHESCSSVAVNYFGCLIMMNYEDIYVIDVSLTELSYDKGLKYMLEQKHPDVLLISRKVSDKKVTFCFPFLNSAEQDQQESFFICRRWVGEEVVFFYFSPKATASSTDDIPSNILIFLMNTILWPMNTCAKFVNLSKKVHKEHFLLSLFLVLISDSPYISISFMKNVDQFYIKRGYHKLTTGWISYLWDQKSWFIPEWVNNIMEMNQCVEKVSAVSPIVEKKIKLTEEFLHKLSSKEKKKVGYYDVSVPICTEGVMVDLKEMKERYGGYTTCFQGYYKDSTGKMSTLEKKKAFKNVGDILVSLDNRDLKGIPKSQIMSIIETIKSDKKRRRIKFQLMDIVTLNIQCDVYTEQNFQDHNIANSGISVDFNVNDILVSNDNGMDISSLESIGDHKQDLSSLPDVLRQAMVLDDDLEPNDDVIECLGAMHILQNSTQPVQSNRSSFIHQADSHADTNEGTHQQMEDPTISPDNKSYDSDVIHSAMLVQGFKNTQCFSQDAEGQELIDDVHKNDAEGQELIDDVHENDYNTTETSQRGTFSNTDFDPVLDNMQNDNSFSATHDVDNYQGSQASKATGSQSIEDGVEQRTSSIIKVAKFSRTTTESASNIIDGNGSFLTADTVEKAPVSSASLANLSQSMEEDDEIRSTPIIQMATSSKTITNHVSNVMYDNDSFLAVDIVGNPPVCQESEATLSQSDEESHEHDNKTSETDIDPVSDIVNGDEPFSATDTVENSPVSQVNKATLSKSFEDDHELGSEGNETVQRATSTEPINNPDSDVMNCNGSFSHNDAVGRSLVSTASSISCAEEDKDSIGINERDVLCTFPRNKFFASSSDLLDIFNERVQIISSDASSISSDSFVSEEEEEKCELCTRNVGKTQQCYNCKRFHHKECGFLIGKGESFQNACNDCGKGKKRARFQPMKDDVLINEWLKPVERKKRDTLVVGVTEAEKEQKMLEKVDEKNVWLATIDEIQYRKKGSKRVYFGRSLRDMRQRIISEVFLREFMCIFFPKSWEDINKKEKRNSWQTLPENLRDLIRSHGRCYSNSNLFINFEKCNEQDWNYVKFSTCCDHPTNICDSPTNFDKRNSCFISFSQKLSGKSDIEYVPLYYLRVWLLMSSLKSKRCEVLNIINHAWNKLNRWVQIDAGSSKNMKMFHHCIVKKHGPISHSIQPHLENSCVFRSLINAFHYINDYKGRDELKKHIETSLDYTQMSNVSHSRPGFAAAIISKNVAGYMIRKLADYDILNDRSIWPTLCILESNDGCINHAVTVVENFIFDSNVKRALELNKANLDWCCSSDYGPSQFVRVHQAYRYEYVKVKPELFIRTDCTRKNGINSFVQAMEHLEDKQAMVAVNSLLYSSSPNECIITLVRDLVRLKKYGYIPKPVKNFEIFMEDHYTDCPSMILVHVSSTFVYCVVSVVENLIYSGESSQPVKFSMKNLFHIMSPDVDYVENQNNIELIFGYLFEKGAKKRKITKS